MRARALGMRLDLSRDDCRHSQLTDDWLRRRFGPRKPEACIVGLGRG